MQEIFPQAFVTFRASSAVLITILMMTSMTMMMMMMMMAMNMILRIMMIFRVTVGAIWLLLCVISKFSACDLLFPRLGEYYGIMMIIVIIMTLWRDNFDLDDVDAILLMVYISVTHDNV